jgi:predicted AAA+ superfamily ATPase
MLPKLFSFEIDEERILFLQAYALTYLKEEVWAEQLTKKLDAFRKFLEVAAQCNGKIINYANIARDVGVDDKTIKEYFSILEDTLIGYILEPYQHSFRKRLSQKPKFYYFDVGVTRTLTRQLSLPLLPSTSAYGDAFEHFIILECMKLASYFYSEYRFSYLRTKDDAEIDLIVERPGKPLLCIEIKSSMNVMPESLHSFLMLTKEIPICEAICFSNDPYAKKIEHVTVLPWQEGVKKYFSSL